MCLKRYQSDHMFLNDNHIEAYMVKRICGNYGFNVRFSESDENNVISAYISGKSEQDLSLLTSVIAEIINILKDYQGDENV